MKKTMEVKMLVALAFAIIIAAVLVTICLTIVSRTTDIGDRFVSRVVTYPSSLLKVGGVIAVSVLLVAVVSDFLTQSLQPIISDDVYENVTIQYNSGGEIARIVADDNEDIGVAALQVQASDNNAMCVHKIVHQCPWTYACHTKTVLEVPSDMYTEKTRK